MFLGSNKTFNIFRATNWWKLMNLVLLDPLLRPRPFFRRCGDLWCVHAHRIEGIPSCCVTGNRTVVEVFEKNRISQNGAVISSFGISSS